MKIHDEELAMYRQCEPLKKQMPEIDILIPGPLDESDKPDLWAKVMDEFEVGQAMHTTIVMVHKLCQKVQELTSGPADSHQIGSEVYSQVEARTASVTGRLENYRRVEVRVEEALQLPEVFLRYRRISHCSIDWTAVHLEEYGCIHDIQNKQST